MGPGVLVLGLLTLPIYFTRQRSLSPAPPRAATEVPSSLQPVGTFGLAPADDHGATGPSQPAPSENPLIPEWNPGAASGPYADFAGWFSRYAQTGDAAERTALEAEGLERALTRRIALAELIRADPERALELAVPVGVRAALPSSVAGLLEERVSGHGDLAVLAALPEPGRETEVQTVWRTATLGEREYQAFVYGRRLGEPTRRGIPLGGIAVDDLLAVQADPTRILPPDEAGAYAALAQVSDCEVCDLPATVSGQPVAAEVGGEVHLLCCPEHAEALNDDLAAAESGGPSGDAVAGEVQASAWTEGLKKVILIRVDFPDLEGVSLTETGGAALINNLHAFYQDMSYGRAGFIPVGSGSDVTPIFRMSNTASYYGSNNYYNQLRTEARSAAAAAGYALSTYNLDVICMGPVPGFGWAGLAYVGSAGAWLRNSFGTGVAGHELGHNFGLHHASFWDTSGHSILGPGSSIEYGDSFDTMGSANAGASHFNARYKSYLNWLQPSETATATTSGTYRVFAHDQALTAGARGLRIVKNSNTNYWVEFRQKLTNNKWLMNGAGLRWAGNGNQKTLLLDTTPGSANARTDSALVIGRTFADVDAGIYITPVAKGGTTPESLDLVVHLGGSPGNVTPTVAVTASSLQAATGTPLEFHADAADANGDQLAYYWDFGDGNFGSNSATATKSWSSAGDYRVRCTVTDMKGGEASASVVVRIGSPSTFAIRGVVTDSNGPMHGVRVYVSTARVAYTDSDGTYSLVGLPAGSYTVSASLYPHTFAPVGFSNPVQVGPDAAGVNFSSSTVLPPTITAQPQSQTVNQGASATFSVTATGTQPMGYQWRFNGNNISGATESTYTRNNVQASDVGHYSVLVSNAGGSVASANAALDLNAPPQITTHPQSRETLAGSDVTFQVTATGTTPLTYQWRLNGNNINGATAASYTRPNVQPADAGAYSVVVGNAFGTATSTPATLSVHFSVHADSTTGGSVTVHPLQPHYAPDTQITLTASSLSVYVFDGWSGDASGRENPLTLTVTTNLNFTAHFVSPVADLIVDDPNATFSGNWSTETSATDRFGSNYRMAGSTPNSASATATFTPTIVTGGRYDIYVWSPTVSKPASAVPLVVSHYGDSMNLSLNQTTGAGGWRLLVAGVPFSPGTSGFVRLSNNVGQGGRNVVADAMRWVYSAVQEATPPAFLTQPQSRSVNVGEEVSFSAEVTGTAPLSYQWQFEGQDVPEATGPSLNLTNVQTSQAGNYRVVVANEIGTATSQIAALTVLDSPRVLTEPHSLAVGIGSNAVFSVVAQGAAPLTYQWRKDDVDLIDNARVQGSATPTLTLLQIEPAQAGAYTVLIANELGSVTSSLALLTVGFEADAFPGPLGDNLVTAGDLEFVGRLLTGLAELEDPFAFIRVDSAPRETLGDGLLSLLDWVQADRYAAELDPPTPAGGPASPLSSVTRPYPGATATILTAPDTTEASENTPSVRVASQWLRRGLEGEVVLELVSQGEVSAAAFTLGFDPAVLVYRRIEWAGAEPDVRLVVNDQSAQAGQIGVLLGRPAGLALTGGTRPLLRLIVAVTDLESVTETTVGFGDEPVFAELATAEARALQARFEPGTLSVVSTIPWSLQSVTVLPDHQTRLTLTGNPGERYAIEASSDLKQWSPTATLTNLTGTVEFLDPETSPTQRFYRARLVVE
jgi:uncharacterized repeat protein (TIGR02543 family)